MSSLDLWDKRARYYNNLDWANSRRYLNAFLKAGKFKPDDFVLDVGTGTGIIAHSISPFVKDVIGLDKSQAMMEHSNWYGNMYFIRKDIRNPLFNENVFDKVTARMVFHHITERTQDAMDECYKLIKDKGAMILSEGIPPTKEVREDYMEIFKLKENRLTFYEEDLVNLMSISGFQEIKTDILTLRGMSIGNWLQNSGLPKKTQQKIFDLHVNAEDYFKEAYNMTTSKDDCFIDMKMCTLTGEKG